MTSESRQGAGGPAERELLLMRHAKSSWDSPTARDFDRELAPRGLRDAPRMGRWLRAEGLVPDHVVCSPARRARATTDAVVEALGLDPSVVREAPRIYEASTADLLAVLGGCPADARRVLLVGHNPGLEMLVARLGGGPGAGGSGKRFPTAAVAHLAFTGTWSGVFPDACRLERLVRPKELPENEPGQV